MIETFRNWINMLLCLGIFTTILQLVMPKNKLRKYIYSLIGIVTIITIVSPFINFLENDKMEVALKQVISNIDETEYENIDEQKYKDVSQEAIKKSFIASLKNDIEEKLISTGIEVRSCEVFIDNDYNIEKIEINIANIDKQNAKISSVTDVVKYINEQYDVEFSRIVVVEEG